MVGGLVGAFVGELVYWQYGPKLLALHVQTYKFVVLDWPQVPCTQSSEQISMLCATRLSIAAAFSATACRARVMDALTKACDATGPEKAMLAESCETMPPTMSARPSVATLAIVAESLTSEIAAFSTGTTSAIAVLTCVGIDALSIAIVLCVDALSIAIVLCMDDRVAPSAHGGLSQALTMVFSCTSQEGCTVGAR